MRKPDVICSLEERRDYVLPFCRRHRCTFRAGMGIWSFWKGHHPVEDARLPHRLLTVLQITAPVDTLGTYVLDVTEEDIQCPGLPSAT